MFPLTTDYIVTELHIITGHIQRDIKEVRASYSEPKQGRSIHVGNARCHFWTTLGTRGEDTIPNHPRQDSRE